MPTIDELGRFSLEALEGIPVFVAMIGDTVEAFCSWLPYGNVAAAAAAARPRGPSS